MATANGGQSTEAIMQALAHHGLITGDAQSGYQLAQSSLGTELQALQSRIRLIEDQNISGTIKTIEQAFVQADQYVKDTKTEVHNLTQQVQASIDEIIKHKDDSDSMKKAIDKVHKDGSAVKDRLESIAKAAEQKFSELEQ